jgi:hypothetical protein
MKIWLFMERDCTTSHHTNIVLAFTDQDKAYELAVFLETKDNSAHGQSRYKYSYYVEEITVDNEIDYERF